MDFSIDLKRNSQHEFKWRKENGTNSFEHYKTLRLNKCQTLAFGIWH